MESTKNTDAAKYQLVQYIATRKPDVTRENLFNGVWTVGPHTQTPGQLLLYVMDKGGNWAVFGSMWLDPKAVKVSTTAECVEVICFHIEVLPPRRKADDMQVMQSQRQYVLRCKEFVETINKENHPKDCEELVARLASLAESSKGELFTSPFLA